MQSNIFSKCKECDKQENNTNKDESEETDRKIGNEIGAIDTNELGQILNGLSNLKDKLEVDKDDEEVMTKRLKIYENDSISFKRNNHSPKNYNNIISECNKDTMERIEHVSKSMKKKRLI